MKLMIWGGNLALTGGDIFAFPDWKEVIRKVGQYGFTPLLSTKIPLKEDDIYFLKESGIKFLLLMFICNALKHLRRISWASDRPTVSE
jgi:hypothetical protein